MLPETRTEERWDLLSEWEQELLLGGALLSEWSTFLMNDAQEAFCAGADLAALLAAQAAIECHLKYEYGDSKGSVRLVDLIDESPLPEQLKERLHELRKYRNRWVHVRDPHADETLLAHPEKHRAELAEMTTKAMRLLMEVAFLEQWV